MKEAELLPLVERFGALIAEQSLCKEAFGII
jgi:hypothetical protein